MTPLPIDAALPELKDALRRSNAAVLVAPPGAGKTTRVPLVLAEEDWARDGKIIVLEPRRLAARAAATRMAATLGEKVGERVGLRVRFGSKVSAKNRIEVVTEGIFTRLILDDPSLSGVAAVLFDEFHERSLDADLGLALARDAQQGLREDLKILVMSATLDGGRVAKLLGDAPFVESAGRAYPVETRYLGRNSGAPLEPQVVDAVLRALRAEPGSILVFLPGAAEIRRTERLLAEKISDKSVIVAPLYGALDPAAQDRAIEPAPKGARKIVLATSIAETSLTIEGVRVVIDSGLSRVPRYEPDVGITRLETLRVSRAAADQRRGRAGRIEPGVCYRLWDEPETGSLEPFTRPEILSADLSGLLLDLAQWRVADPAALSFLDAPPAPALKEARALLVSLGAIDGAGRITEEGRKLRALPLPPRLARMVVDAAREGAGEEAALIAALIGERGLGGDDVDLTHRLDRLKRDRSARAEDVRAMAGRWAKEASGAGGKSRAAVSPGALLALAYPERLAKNRGAGTGFLLANGRGAMLDPASALAREPYLVAAEVTGSAAQGRIVAAAPITSAEIENRFADRIETAEETFFDSGTLGLRARKARRLGAVALAEQIAPAQANEANARAFAVALAREAWERLPWTPFLRQWRDRVMFLRRAQGDEWPDLTDAALKASAAEWLAPLFDARLSFAELDAEKLTNAIHERLDWKMRKHLDAEAPTHFAAPTGTRVPIDYEADEGPKIAIRLQELFGLDRHPSIAGGRVPLVVELLSPAHRPVQVTRDLPGFWRGSYQSVKSEMKGRYPRHPWPDNPLAAPPTRRAKPRAR